MKLKKFEILSIKFFCSNINAKELDALVDEIDSRSNDKIFKNCSLLNFAINRCMNNYDSDKSKKLLLDKIRKDKSLKYKLSLRTLAKYAAVAVFFLSVGYYFHEDFIFSGGFPKDGQTPNNLISLEIDGEAPKVLSEFQNINIKSNNNQPVVRQEGNELIYKSNSQATKISYSTLSIPYGKRFSLSLSDGTKIHMNAGSSIKFPNVFVKGKKREVFLTGEAFFEVAKDSLHPFVVNTNGPKIKVIGTKFNVSAYANESNINTVLVEGSIGLAPKGRSLEEENLSILNPGYMAVWSKDKADFSYKEIDTSNYTAWITGKIVFNHIPFGDIVKKLERHYNVTIINHDKKLDQEIFTASFDIETIEEVLNAFDKSYPINFIRSKNKIIIN